jgi:hypothetical protein
MNINYQKLSQLYIEELNTKLGHNKHFCLIKELFDKNNKTLIDYFAQCTKLTDMSILY